MGQAISKEYYGTAEWDLTGGETYGIVLPIHGRGTLTRFDVWQLSGTKSGFTYTLYNKREACQADGSAASGVPEEMFRILGPVTVASGESTYKETVDTAWPNIGVLGFYVPYYNRSIGSSASTTVNEIYIKITPVASGAFGVALTSEMWDS